MTRKRYRNLDNDTLRSFPGFEHLTDEQCQDVIVFTNIIVNSGWEIYQREKDEAEENKG
jgi:hypothetical protein